MINNKTCIINIASFVVTCLHHANMFITQSLPFDNVPIYHVFYGIVFYARCYLYVKIISCIKHYTTKTQKIYFSKQICLIIKNIIVESKLFVKAIYQGNITALSRAMSK